MKEVQIRRILKSVVSLLVSRDYEKVYNGDKNKRISANEIKDGISDYPGHLTLPPDSAFNTYWDYGEEDDEENIIEYDLWFNNEMSDLTIVLTLYEDGKYSIEDILVL